MRLAAKVIGFVGAFVEGVEHHLRHGILGIGDNKRKVGMFQSTIDQE